MPTRLEISRTIEIADAKEFSATNQDLSIENGGPCINAPCNPGPGGPPPRCAPRPPQPRCGSAEVEI